MATKAHKYKKKKMIHSIRPKTRNKPKKITKARVNYEAHDWPSFIRVSVLQFLYYIALEPQEIRGKKKTLGCNLEKTTKKMISNLPTDLIEEILSRLDPLKSMRAVRLTCKKWNALSKNPSFMKMHISKAAEKTKEGESEMMVMLRDYNLYLMSVVNGFEADPYKEDKGKLTCLNGTEQVKIVDVFHCEGLLLCVLKDTLNLVVWNPYLGQTRWIQPRYAFLKEGRHHGHGHRYAFGYENKKNKSCRSHKILRFIDAYTLGKNNKWYEIYDFDSDLWTTLDVTPHWRIEFCDRGVSFKGNTYWCGLDEIFCFDFTKERFGPLLNLSFSAPLDDREHFDVMKLSCFREEKLVAFVQWHELQMIEIWITTNIEYKKLSWREFLVVFGGPAARNPITYCDFFIDEVKKVAMVFDKDRSYNSRLLNRETINIIGEAGYFRKVNLGEPEVNKWSKPIACSYAPSLVQIKEAVDSERKTQSDLEKHRFEQNMSIFVEIEKRLDAIYRR